jgi:pimeloyl-ACP methyl ester carboxylesterase
MAQNWTEPESQLIRSYVDKAVGSDTFVNAERLVAFLRYLVEANLAGNEERVDQNNIAIDLMGRDAGFDPSVDSIVRVEAGRLRSKLRDYYLADGQDDEVKFELPKGRYRIKINLAQAAAPIPEATKIEAHQDIRLFRTKDGTTIAYSISGNGPYMVKAANWMSHLEYDYLSPVWRHWWMDLSKHYSLVRYDERGCGLSDWDVKNFCFDAWVEDLEEVVDIMGLHKFVLLGISQGASVAVAYAARHPEKVSHLILYGGFAQGHRVAASGPEDIEELDLLEDLIRVGWGRAHPAFRQTFSSLFIPEGTTEQFRHLNELQRISTSPENAQKFFHAFHQVDVVDLAGQIKAPTMVLHARNDAGIPFKQGRFLASCIRGAKFVPLESNNHILIEGEPAWDRFMQEVTAFLQT